MWDPIDLRTGKRKGRFGRRKKQCRRCKKVQSKLPVINNDTDRLDRFMKDLKDFGIEGSEQYLKGLKRDVDVVKIV